MGKEMKRLLAIGVILLFVGLTISSTGLNVEKQLVKPLSFGNTLYVGGSGSNNYTSIQDAIDDASDGDTIYVYSRTYNEWIRINKQLYIIGIEQSNQSAPLIEGGSDHDTVIIEADGCHFDNFRIRNGFGGYLEIGITLKSNNNVISNCSSYDTSIGLRLISSSNNLISNNEMWGGWNGIELNGFCSNNSFFDNYIHSHNHDEITISENSHNNRFYNNTISNSKFGDGFKLWYVSDILFENNTISSNRYYGIRSISAMNLTLLNNKFIKNGVRIKGNLVHFTSHKIEGNTVNGKPLYYYVNRDNFIVPSDGGQVILMNCKDGSINNLNISETYIGIHVIQSSRITISDNYVSETRWGPGIRITYSLNNIISNNTISKCNGGILMSSSDYNNISDNKINEMYDRAECIKVTGSSYNKIHRNSVSNSEIGISVSGSDNNISDNAVYYCKDFGIKLSDKDSIIWGNTIQFNMIGIYINSSDNSFLHNNFIANLQQNVHFEGFCLNKWRHNYWNRPRVIPKPISGVVWLTFFPIPFYNFDWHPALAPYDIGV
jgi:parallel beta-helix repeat protein